MFCTISRYTQAVPWHLVHRILHFHFFSRSGCWMGYYYTNNSIEILNHGEDNVSEKKKIKCPLKTGSMRPATIHRGIVVITAFSAKLFLTEGDVKLTTLHRNTMNNFILVLNTKIHYNSGRSSKHCPLSVVNFLLYFF